MTDSEIMTKQVNMRLICLKWKSLHEMVDVLREKLLTLIRYFVLLFS